MATRYWLGGNAPLAAQVQTFTVTADSASTTYEVTIGGVTVSVVGTGSGVDATATAIQTALNDSAAAQFTEVTWTVAAATITATANVAGYPFTFTLAVSGGSGTLGSIATVTANGSPNDVGNALNWSSQTLPVSGLAAAPVQANASVTSGGSLSDGTTYYYVITALNANGETTASNEKNTGVISGSNQTAVLTWALVAGATGYNVYRGTSTGAENKLLTTASSSTTTYNDTGTAGTTQSPPVSNTAIGDTPVWANGNVASLYGLSAFASSNFPAVYVYASYAAVIGLPTVNGNGYPEYRPQELQFGTATILQEFLPQQMGAAGRKYNTGSNPCTALFVGLGNGQFGSEITWWRGTSASNVVNANGASLAISAIPAYTATVATLSAIAGSVVRCGLGVAAMTTGTITNSSLVLQANITTMNINGASNITCQQTMTVGTLTINGGNVVYNSSGTITTLTLGSQDVTGSIDFSQALPAVTITNLITAYLGSTFYDPLGRVTAAGGLTIPAGQLSNINFTTGLGLTYEW